MGEDEVRLDHIERIDPVSLDGDHHLGVGMVVRAVAGGVLGHQFGSAPGKDARVTRQSEFAFSHRDEMRTHERL